MIYLGAYCLEHINPYYQHDYRNRLMVYVELSDGGKFIVNLGWQYVPYLSFVSSFIK